MSGREGEMEGEEQEVKRRNLEGGRERRVGVP